MTYALDAVLVHVIGAVNVVVFRMSRGRVLVHRFDGPPHVRLTEIGQVPELDPLWVDYLRDGDDYVLFVAARQSDERWVRDLRAATSATVEIEEGTARSAVSVVGDGEEVRRLREEAGDGVVTREIDADVFPVVDEAERSAVAARLLKGASLDERYEVRKRRMVAVARLKAR
ncbi:hypothetical protein [Actinoallomurus acanthiterrae]